MNKKFGSKKLIIPQELDNNFNKNQRREQLADKLMEKYHFATLPNEQIFVYEDGVYTDRAEIVIKEEIVKALSSDFQNEDITNILNRIKGNTFVDYDFFEEPSNIICVNNGIIELDTSSFGDGKCNFMQYTPNFHFQNKLKINYDLSLNSCPKIGKLIYDILPSQQAVRCFYEFLGYCLYRGYPIHKAIMLVGEGSNGKSTLLNLMKDFLGKENTTSIALQKICSDRFTSAELFGKMLNFFADLTDIALTDTGMWKALTGNDQICAEIKFKQRQLNFTNYSKFAFSSNKIPENKGDDSDAFWRRWIIIQCTQIFDEDHNNVQKDILNTMFSTDAEKQAEFSALLLHAILGLKRLLKNGKFSSDGMIVIDGKEKVRDAWTRNDVVRMFVDDCIEQDSTSYIPKATIFEAYIRYQNEKFPTFPPLDMSVFHRKLRKFVAVFDEYKKIDNDRVNCYVGIKLKPVDSKTTQQKISNSFINSNEGHLN